MHSRSAYINLEDRLTDVRAKIGEPRMDSGMILEQQRTTPFNPLTPLLPLEVCWILDRSFSCEVNTVLLWRSTVVFYFRRWNGTLEIRFLNPYTPVYTFIISMTSIQTSSPVSGQKKIQIDRWSLSRLSSDQLFLGFLNLVP